MRIHQEGYTTIGLTFLILGGLLAFSLAYLPRVAAIGVGVIALVILLVIIRFFRHPDRTAPELNDSYIYAPADGKVVVIEEVSPKDTTEKKLQISIFMSPFNVHVNWLPIAGTIKTKTYFPGRHLPAWHPKSSTDNEKMSITIANNSTEIIVEQIAGIMARRIKNYLNSGDQVRQSAEMGFIKLGSRIDILLPVTATANVQIGDKVKGTETVIARL